MIHPDNLTWPEFDGDDADAHPGPVIGQAGLETKGTHHAAHRHQLAQLFHIATGSVTVETEQGTFVVPNERALWIPSNVVHAVTYVQDSAIRYLFFRSAAVAHLPHTPSVVRLSPLLRELALAFLSYPRSDAGHGPAARIGGVILDQLTVDPITPLHLPMPASARLRAAVADLVATPQRPDTLAEVAAQAAMSERSFERHFRAETGLSFRAWRRQAKLIKAVELLSLGVAVGEIAHQLGYEEPSAFIAAFRNAFATTPGRYFAPEG